MTAREGPIWNVSTGEYHIFIDDVLVGFHGGPEQEANDRYNDELATRRQHVQRNPANIPFMGEPVAIDDEGNGLAAGVDY